MMGADPGSSVLNRYLQSWDADNLFVMGASVFPQNQSYNPTGFVGALAYCVGPGHHHAVLEEAGPLGPSLRYEFVHAREGIACHASSSRARCRVSRVRQSPPALSADAEPRQGALCRPARRATQDKPDALGPSLKGVVGRKSAALDDFRYSNPMKRANLVWDEANLREYIADPQAKGEGQPDAVRRRARIPRTSTISSNISRSYK